jgi:hypothetical protein
MSGGVGGPEPAGASPESTSAVDIPVPHETGAANRQRSGRETAPDTENQPAEATAVIAAQPRGKPDHAPSPRTSIRPTTARSWLSQMRNPCDACQPFTVQPSRRGTTATDDLLTGPPPWRRASSRRKRLVRVESKAASWRELDGRAGRRLDAASCQSRAGERGRDARNHRPDAIVESSSLRRSSSRRSQFRGHGRRRRQPQSVTPCFLGPRKARAGRTATTE